MSKSPDHLKAHGDALFQALVTRSVVAPLTDLEPDLTIEDAYRISECILAHRLARGERVIGKKIGVTSEPVQRMLNVDQPDFGFLTDTMQIPPGGTLVLGEQAIQARAEGEIALVLGRELRGPGVTPADVLAAIRGVRVAIEIVDSRIRDWKIRIQDTVADNASSGFFVVGTDEVPPDGFDFEKTGLVMHLNGSENARGHAAMALGSPLVSTAWLANAMGQFGAALGAGEVILSGSLVPLQPVKSGDHVRCELAGVGAVEVHFR
ncbi:MAG: fumarylacetoacetate hydrolase family protein [Gammaproteobacteria bacterium]|nr:fumarylacetoacetate hydrolase family protein [Gammaproteobacteria bacterium]MBI5618097.1 fumarylacetoacetate hydrolase family protein [Gammaproteobacteria bacterium]